MTEEHKNFMNRRTFARANIYVLGRFVRPLNEDVFEDQARISDISERGALIVTAGGGELPQGTLIKMNFVIPGNGIADMMARVKYSEPVDEYSYQSGIEFLNPEERHCLAIRKYVTSHVRS